ncbi:ANR family transcriptional regulator [Escherichia coli]|uniref:ANR family transcriptional regulator n=1 Tax=Escherichia coli TaxID=562 RepID=UPI00050B7D64|nr:ANR family transcriptional regulator [Escherichia coli]
MLPKNSYNNTRHFAHLASNAERKKKYDIAAQLWEKVLRHALSNENIEWAFRRKNFCIKQISSHKKNQYT